MKSSDLSIGNDGVRAGVIRIIATNLDLRILPDVTIITPTNYFNFTPLLASCAVGTLEFRAAVEPVNSIIRIPFLH